jgi:hypothetical protein
LLLSVGLCFLFTVSFFIGRRRLVHADVDSGRYDLTLGYFRLNVQLKLKVEASVVLLLGLGEIL